MFTIDGYVQLLCFEAKLVKLCFYGLFFNRIMRFVCFALYSWLMAYLILALCFIRSLLVAYFSMVN